MEYIRSLDQQQKEQGCFLCDYWQHPEQDDLNHVVWRGDAAYVVMNRFPYTNGHLLISLAAHVGDLAVVPDQAFAEMSHLIRQSVQLLQRTVKAQGFNIGYNIGLCAGAGLPDHIHAHVVPRWNGDTNFMAVLGDSRVVPDSLDALHKELVIAAEDAGLGTSR